MNKRLQKTISSFDDKIIANHRHVVLRPLIVYISDQLKVGNSIALNFICTHNSRRSQISQVWAQILAWHYHLPITAYSGGVEVTAFNPRAIQALMRAGFNIERQEGEVNPRYHISSSAGGPKLIGYSKVYDDPNNDCSDYAAIMTCDHANNYCPIISEAAIRIPILYEDPKWADNTDQEQLAYDTTVLDIGKELNYVYTQVINAHLVTKSIK